ncbi:plexin-B-like [Tachypleus tridentatus]|uniref:plexin-B-like n=1 Tax=Tachypleus tridentatus TaxID=6853 RepID=UPI003FCF3371
MSFLFTYHLRPVAILQTSLTLDWEEAAATHRVVDDVSAQRSTVPGGARERASSHPPAARAILIVTSPHFRLVVSVLPAMWRCLFLVVGEEIIQAGAEAASNTHITHTLHDLAMSFLFTYHLRPVAILQTSLTLDWEEIIQAGAGAASNTHITHTLHDLAMSFLFTYHLRPVAILQTSLTLDWGASSGLFCPVGLHFTYSIEFQSASPLYVDTDVDKVQMFIQWCVDTDVDKVEMFIQWYVDTDVDEVEMFIHCDDAEVATPTTSRDAADVVTAAPYRAVPHDVDTISVCPRVDSEVPLSGEAAATHLVVEDISSRRSTVSGGARERASSHPLAGGRNFDRHFPPLPADIDFVFSFVDRTLSHEQAHICDAPFTVPEVLAALDSLPLGKSPVVKVFDPLGKAVMLKVKHDRQSNDDAEVATPTTSRDAADVVTAAPSRAVPHDVDTISVCPRVDSEVPLSGEAAATHLVVEDISSRRSTVSGGARERASSHPLAGGRNFDRHFPPLPVSEEIIQAGAGAASNTHITHTLHDLAMSFFFTYHLPPVAILQTSLTLDWGASSGLLCPVGLHFTYSIEFQSASPMLLSSKDMAEEFEEVFIDPGHPILSDIHLDPSEKFLYIASPYTLSKVVIDRCQQYTTCEGCLESRNPYCGWCSLERRCTVKMECQNATLTYGYKSTRWLSMETQKCIDVQSVDPDMIPLDAMVEIKLVINQLPKLPNDAHYLCIFGNSTPTTANSIESGLSCRTPLLKERPVVQPGNDHVIVDLAIRSSETNTDFLHIPFKLYDCSVHKTCSRCVNSAWKCKWCIHQNECIRSTNSCQGTVVKVEIHDSDLGKSKERNGCPRLNLKNEILISDGEDRRIELDVQHVPIFMNDIHCVIETEGERKLVEAQVLGSRIFCAKTTYTYKTQIGKLKFNLTLVWRRVYVIDRTTVTLYKCNLLTENGNHLDCSLCLTRDLRYKCVWCRDSCKFRDSCPSRDVIKTCPPPRIDLIHPVTGPLQGGTLVTIKGSNLGTIKEDIQDKITIGGIPCQVVEYNVSVRVVCRTGESPTVKRVEVVVGNNAGRTTATEKFSYQNVILTNVYPNKGPQSGGTHLFLSGSNLNIGSNIQVFLDKLPCIIYRTLASNSQISCRTTRAPYPSYNVTQLVLQVDDASLMFPNPFTYVNDPTILRIYPLKSFAGGGRSIIVDGTYLSSVQQPWMAVFRNNTLVNKTLCTVRSPNQMICPSPTIKDENFFDQEDVKTLEPVDQLKYRLSFLMDDVKKLLNLQEHFPTLHSDIIYVPNPQFLRFKNDGIKQYKGEPLVIEGSGLLLAASESEVSVKVGTCTCNLTSLTMTQLVCLPPKDQPSTSDNQRSNTDLPLVVVNIGENLQYEIGYLRYEVTKLYEFPREVIWGVAVGGVLLIILSVITLLTLRYKSSQAEQEYKSIQLQMDTLENSVRSECKQAFAELQTDMTDITSDLQASGIPILDHRTFVVKVFFPGVHGHPLLQTNVKSNGFCNNYNAAMNQFQLLLLNKTFLITFIGVLEAQKTFTIKDRVNVASLLMIVLMEKMEYATDILKTLLSQLIEKSVKTTNPQLMLRRTESVVEKMLTNWMVLNMYDYLKDHASRSLFLLFSAMKHQVEKGPIDALTNDARFSLSEQKLLKECIEYLPVTIHVFQENQDKIIQIKVNDCDTISQVKAKILDVLYNNTPFSLQPSINEVDLEWRRTHNDNLTLVDEDYTSVTSGGWRRLNTLKHYGVRRFAVMNILINQNSFSSNSTEETSWGSVMPVMNTLETEPGMKYWHLIKPMDNHNHQSIRPEIFLTRLLSTKGTVEKFVNDFLNTVFTVTENFPACVKWLFDLLDEAASKHGITDPEIGHAWKSNSLTLRFWVNFIKNPDFILDINKTPLLDSCLSVIAQTLMDACSTNEHRLGKDSPSNKLLFAKDILAHKRMVTTFYKEVAQLPAITNQQLSVSLQKLSLVHRGEFDSMNAVKDLYIYLERYVKEMLTALTVDPVCTKTHLAYKLQTVTYILQGEETSVC